MELISKLTVTGAANINIGFNPYTFYTQNNNYMKIELAHDFTVQSASLYGYLYRCSSKWFSFENGKYGCYFNIANTTGIISVDSLPNLRTTDGVTNPISIVMDDGTATATQGSDTQTNTYSGNMPDGDLIFYPSTYSNGYGGEFYGLKIYGAGDVLAHHYVGFDDGVDVGIEDLVTGDKYTPTGSGYTIQCEEYTPPTPPTPTSTSKIYLGYTNLVAGKIKLGANDVSAIYLGTSLLYPPTAPQPTPPSLSDCVCFTAVAPNAKISLNPAPSDYSANLYYSTDGGTTFNTLEPHTNITLANIGDKMYVYGNNASLGQSVHFQISADTSISGNLTTLLNPDGLTTLPDYAFVGTFKNNTHIVDVSGLTIPVTSVGQFALQSLFSGCTNITTAPALTATTIGNGCYSYMFYGCTSLTSAPALPATTLATQCYYGMFQGCTSLITPPSLPATILATYCYSSMFAGCTSLTTSPDLNALTLLHSSYAAMFYGCTNLNSIKCLATNISAQACTNGWVDGVSATGTFTKSPQMSNWTTGVDGIPTGWTVVDAQ